MLANLKTFLIDLDGVIYRGNSLLPDVQHFLDWLERHQKNYLFLTNNSFASEADVVQKLQKLGIATDRQHVLSAGQAAIHAIARRFPAGRVYLVGESSFQNMALEAGLTIVDIDDTNADVVLVGLDRAFNYQKLTTASQAILQGADFIAVNRDHQLPVENQIIPGCGAMVAAIEAVVRRRAVIIGKPEPALLQEAMQLFQTTPEETVMIGDGMDTDIQAGKAAKTRTLLVMTGKETYESLKAYSFRADYLYQDLTALLADLS